MVVYAAFFKFIVLRTRRKVEGYQLGKTNKTINVFVENQNILKFSTRFSFCINHTTTASTYLTNELK